MGGNLVHRRALLALPHPSPCLLSLPRCARLVHRHRAALPPRRTTSVQNLMYVKEDVIMPHTVTFYDLIINKAQAGWRGGGSCRLAGGGAPACAACNVAGQCREIAGSLGCHPAAQPPSTQPCPTTSPPCPASSHATLRGSAVQGKSGPLFQFDLHEHATTSFDPRIKSQDSHAGGCPLQGQVDSRAQQMHGGGAALQVLKGRPRGDC